MICYARFHRWRDTQRLVDSAEIVVHGIERDRVLQTILDMKKVILSVKNVIWDILDDRFSPHCKVTDRRDMKQRLRNSSDAAAETAQGIRDGCYAEIINAG
jgi:hypothetical protein